MRTAPPPFDPNWMAHLGLRRDIVVSEQLGVAKSRVSETRRSLGIPAAWNHKWHNLKWYDLRLMPLREQCVHLNTSLGTLAGYRRAIGLGQATISLGGLGAGWRGHSAEVARGAHAYMASQLVSSDWLISSGYTTMADLDAVREACRIKGFAAPMLSGLAAYADFLGDVPDTRLAKLADCDPRHVATLRNVLQIPTCELHWLLDRTALAATMVDEHGVTQDSLSVAWGWSEAKTAAAIALGRLHNQTA